MIPTDPWSPTQSPQTMPDGPVESFEAYRAKLKGVVHPRSCVNCAWQWYHEPEYEEVMYSGPAGFVCDGPIPGMANLKGFPFRTERKCFSTQRFPR